MTRSFSRFAWMVAVLALSLPSQGRAQTTEDKPHNPTHVEESPTRASAVLGVIIEPESDGKGARVVEVLPDTPAAKAGLREGDHILRVNDEQVRSGKQLSQLIGKLQPGTEIKLQFRRQEEEHTALVKLAASQDTMRKEVREGIKRERAKAREDRPRRERDKAEAAPREGEPDDAAWLGVILRDEREGDGKQAVLIAAVHPAGPAAEAGLRPGDVLVRIGDQSINSPEDARRVIQERKPRDRVAVTVRRDDKEKQLDVTLGSSERMLRSDRMQPGQRVLPPGRDKDRPEAEEFRHEASHDRIQKTLDQLLREVREIRREMQQMRTNKGEGGAERERAKTRER